MKKLVKQTSFTSGLPLFMRFHGTLGADSVIQDDTVIKEIAKKFAGEGFVTLSMENETNGINDCNSAKQQLAIYRAILNA